MIASSPTVTGGQRDQCADRRHFLQGSKVSALLLLTRGDGLGRELLPSSEKSASDRIWHQDYQRVDVMGQSLCE
jgi:hypothetical protein